MSVCLSDQHKKICYMWPHFIKRHEDKNFSTAVCIPFEIVAFDTFVFTLLSLSRRNKWRWVFFRIGVSIPPGIFVPYNAQATLHSKEVDLEWDNLKMMYILIVSHQMYLCLWHLKPLKACASVSPHASKHLKGHLAPRVSDVTFFNQRDILDSLSMT